MCLAIPAQIVAISNPEQGIAVAQTQGVQREVNISMLALSGVQLDALPGQWVLLHVGFAMAVIDQEEANRTLAMLDDIEGEGHA